MFSKVRQDGLDGALVSPTTVCFRPSTASMRKGHPPGNPSDESLVMRGEHDETRRRTPVTGRLGRAPRQGRVTWARPSLQPNCRVEHFVGKGIDGPSGSGSPKQAQVTGHRAGGPAAAIGGQGRGNCFPGSLTHSSGGFPRSSDACTAHAGMPSHPRGPGVWAEGPGPGSGWLAGSGFPGIMPVAELRVHEHRRRRPTVWLLHKQGVF